MCECVREAEAEARREAERLWLCLLGEWSAGVFVWMCTGGFANLCSSKGKTEREEQDELDVPVSPYRVSAAVTFNPLLCVSPSCSPLAQLLCQPPNEEQGEGTAEVRRQREIEIRRAFCPVKWASGDKSITAFQTNGAASLQLSKPSQPPPAPRALLRDTQLVTGAPLRAGLLFTG